MGYKFLFLKLKYFQTNMILREYGLDKESQMLTSGFAAHFASGLCCF